MSRAELYPATPGWKGTETSRAAAAKIAPRAPSMRRRIWEALTVPKSGECLSEELSIYLYSALPRLSEMKAEGIVRESGETEATARGNDQTVWERVPGMIYRDRLTGGIAPIERRLKAWQVQQIREAINMLRLSPTFHAREAEQILLKAMPFLND